MNFRTVLSCALLATVSCSVFAAKPSTPDVQIASAAKGGDKIEISFDDKHLYVSSGSFDVNGTSAHGGRYYRRGANTSGEPLWEMKDGADGFKLVDPAGKLLWKVKFDADKVKIADNEEMKNAWSVKMHPDHAKVYDAKDVEVGEAKVNKDSGKVKIKDAHGKDVYVVEIGGRFTAGYGVLLMKSIPEQQREVLAADVFMHGK